ncbi:phosphosulfolactate synthase [Aquibacillus kalidii]|uniref:phosphosulfolactate synthase n=1 Tax=Aquibacillus kalidii TaxID=2762597 RepID=UPI0016497317|nr:phosphosulfolactate synthase [Aquibacillus kalidii]
MTNVRLNLPERQQKPRGKGLTILIDNGVPLNLFMDTIHSGSNHIDIVKFGWGTSLVSPFLQDKIEFLRERGIGFFFGGTLFEKFVSQGKVDDYYALCKEFGCEYVEISNGTIELSVEDKAACIRTFSREFTVFSEVGHKDTDTSNSQDSNHWLASIIYDLEAGASKVITEARESGTSGICREDGNIRTDIFTDIAESAIPMERLIFEAPNKKMQTFFIKQVGANVNLANIAFSDVISLETLRLGLRSDTFHHFEQKTDEVVK